MSDIDFVILWVDGNDPNWLKEKSKYDINIKEKDYINSSNRYRDWNNLQYWFRSVEKYTPWVRKIHFITWGHLPKWLNINNPKLDIVKHEDYIPKEYLPTFNSNVIELNLHRIADLSENFVLFNDDNFMNRMVTEEFFFKNNLPCDSAILNALIMEELFSYTVANDLFIINKHFNKEKSINENKSKWLNLKYGKAVLKNIFFNTYKSFSGFYDPHVATSHKKSVFKEVWDKEYELLDNACKNKFRSNNDISQWLFRYWNLASGNFYPRAKSCSKLYPIHDDYNISSLSKDILSQQHTLICINDDIKDTKTFDTVSNQLIETFKIVFPEKSSFEI